MILWSKAAKDMLHYLIHRNPASAADIVGNIYRTGDMLDRNPFEGHRIDRELLKLIVHGTKYVVHYAVMGGNIYILSVYQSGEDRPAN